MVVDSIGRRIEPIACLCDFAVPFLLMIQLLQARCFRLHSVWNVFEAHKTPIYTDAGQIPTPAFTAAGCSNAVVHPCTPSLSGTKATSLALSCVHQVSSFPDVVTCRYQPLIRQIRWCLEKSAKTRARIHFLHPTIVGRRKHILGRKLVPIICYSKFPL